MNRKLYAVLILFVFSLFISNSFSQDKFFALGGKLEKDLFETVKNKDWASLDTMIASGFQSMHADGPKSRSAAIEYIKSITFKYYHFFDMVVTNNDDVSNLVISYKLSFSENLELTESEKGNFVNNISVWQNTDGSKWQWISHSVFDCKVK
jgi:hypothetical protein